MPATEKKPRKTDEQRREEKRAAVYAKLVKLMAELQELGDEDGKTALLALTNAYAVDGRQSFIPGAMRELGATSLNFARGIAAVLNEMGYGVEVP